MAEPRENKMGVMPVKKLIITMSLPMMISMLVQALYNVVDSMFVARLSEDALTAVTLAFPMQNALISFAAGTGVGINALLSKSLGEKKFDRADAAANNGLFLGGMTYILFLLIGLFGAAPFIGTQIRDPLVREYGATYLRICLCLSFGAIFQITFERLLQSRKLVSPNSWVAPHTLSHPRNNSATKRTITIQSAEKVNPLFRFLFGLLMLDAL